MPKRKTAKHSKRAPTTRKRRTLISIVLVLCLFTAGGALAQWSGIVSLGQKNAKKSGEVTSGRHEQRCIRLAVPTPIDHDTRSDG